MLHPALCPQPSNVVHLNVNQSIKQSITQYMRGARAAEALFVYIKQRARSIKHSSIETLGTCTGQAFAEALKH
jgi:hypothetical protein